MPRVLVTNEHFALSSALYGKELDRQLKLKGCLSFTSSHEVLGIIAEEYTELIDAVKQNDMEAVLQELVHIGVASQFAVASIMAGGMDW